MMEIILLTGATQSGKTRLAIELAQNNDALLIPIDQLQMYKHLEKGVGLEKALLKEVRSTGYQNLDPWIRLSPSKYVKWLRSILIQHKKEELIIIEGGCTSYLKEVVRRSINDPVLKTINFVAINIDSDDYARRKHISTQATKSAISGVIDEIKVLGEKGFYNNSGLELFRECEHKFIHPEYNHSGLAWALRISAGVYYPAHLALTRGISFESARSRIIHNIFRIQTYQIYRIKSILPKISIFNYEEARKILNQIVMLKKAA